MNLDTSFEGTFYFLHVIRKAARPPARKKYEMAKAKQRMATISDVILNPIASVTNEPYAGAMT